MKDFIIFAVLLFFLFMLMTKSDDKYGYNKYGYRKYGYNKNKKETVGGVIENSGDDPDNMDENKLFNMINSNEDDMIDKEEFNDFMKLPHTHDNYVEQNEFNEFKAHDHDDDDNGAVKMFSADDDSGDGATGTTATGTTGTGTGATGTGATGTGVALPEKVFGGFNDVMGYDMDDNYNYL